MHTQEEKLVAIGRLLTIMDELRVQCPWDKKQTFESLRSLTIEEVYELADSISSGDTQEMQGELGDLLMHIVFYAKIGSEKGLFDVKTIADGICDKLIYRHPHIYGDVKVSNEQEVLQNWEELKLKAGRKSVLEGVPTSLPAIIKALRMQEKASGIGFDWSDKADVWAKVEEEIQEFKVEEQAGNKALMEKEFGDILFSLVNYARFVGIDPEHALAQTNQKFLSRFQLMEDLIQTDQKELPQMNLEQMDVYWEKAKQLTQPKTK
ncbi:nucleoside triphosphate pyrophosphohydrolase [Myroides sp. DF42-4-2]|uniref:nucleoside triphosphate pyrophosphohydrolase n=1 Tax=Myroides sp. DF42-4-2 TaxID=2746726 RepID=UPI00257919F9|nr:nucleoside triphosphate pyrophosphohydrolase [Myroides sp. DF42-4-2]MDM1408967.1 nucleoside triphosphate pyrophosphohydrolase [Myroides sp. DF42-4-2]